MTSRSSAENVTLQAALPESPIRVEIGPDRLLALGELARGEGARRALLVTDAGIVAAGHIARALSSLGAADIAVTIFDGACENPTTREVDLGLALARNASIDFLIAVGGGSAMDCAKGINLLFANGGQISDYRGDPDLPTLADRRPLLPMILAPTTTGTGSEAQSFALISDAQTHQKMPCGDRRPPTQGGLRPRIALLDPQLARTQPRAVLAAAGIDAIVHSVETAGCRRRSEFSRTLSFMAWERLIRALPLALQGSAAEQDWADLLLGAHLAGAAIEASMLGAAHACANPLTARFGVTHGVAVGLMAPSVVRFNVALGDNPYHDLLADAESVASAIEGLLAAADFPLRLRDLQIAASDLPELSRLAAQQWTAGFNPRPVSAESLLAIYHAAL